MRLARGSLMFAQHLIWNLNPSLNAHFNIQTSGATDQCGGFSLFEIYTFLRPALLLAVEIRNVLHRAPFVPGTHKDANQ